MLYQLSYARVFAIRQTRGSPRQRARAFFRGEKKCARRRCGTGRISGCELRRWARSPFSFRVSRRPIRTPHRLRVGSFPVQWRHRTRPAEWAQIANALRTSPCAGVWEPPQPARHIARPMSRPPDPTSSATTNLFAIRPSPDPLRCGDAINGECYSTHGERASARRCKMPT